MSKVDYSGGAPADYRCSTCGKHGVKQWRQYNTLACVVELMCKRCAEADQGKHPVNLEHCDQIGWMVPAVPTEDGETFWGYSAVPDPGVQWWKRLPIEVSE